jgi:3',5'-cyclic-nucleotide phosphodiesterase
MTKLYILNGPNKGQFFELKGDTIYIGRSPDNDIQMKDLTVSLKHLKIVTKANKYFIEDLKSKNGTFVSGKQINPDKEFEVKEGIPIAIGGTVICLGKVYPEDDLDMADLAILDSIDFSKELGENGKVSAQDRILSLQRNMELVYKVSDVLMQSLDINETLEKILNYILDLLKRTDRGFFILVDDETGEISESISIFKKRKDDNTDTYSRKIVDRVIREGKAVIMSNTLMEDEANLSESMKLMKIKSVMCVPLISRSKIRGVLYIDSINKPYGFRRGDLFLLTALGSSAAIAIENASLYSRKNIGDRTDNFEKDSKKDSKK